MQRNDVLTPLSREEYEALGVMPYQDMPEESRARIETQLIDAVLDERAPARWLAVGGGLDPVAMLPSRAWWEWHVRVRGCPPGRRPAITEPMREAVIQRDGMVCGLCGGQIASRADLHIDHTKPLARGGEHALHNLQPAHAACNLSKGDAWEAPE